MNEVINTVVEGVGHLVSYVAFIVFIIGVPVFVTVSAFALATNAFCG